jgi:hypothetical protein
MARHVLVAGIVAALSLGSLTSSLEASARPGGPGGPGAGRAGGGHVGFHRGGVRPFVHGRHVHGHAGHRFAPHGGHRGKVARHHHKRGIGLGLPLTAVGFINGPLADPALIAPGVPDAAVSGGAVFYRHVCRSDVEIVPSGRGGEVPVTVTRCYVVAD